MTAPDDQLNPAIEPDPTGMRALLRALPDPGPMPADLAERIRVSLTAEQALRTSTPDPSTAPTQEPGTAPVDLAAYRERRARRLKPALVAATAAMALTGIGLVATAGGPGAVVASSTADSAAGDVRGGAENGPALAFSSATPLYLSASGQDWSTPALTSAAPAMLAGELTTIATGDSPGTPLTPDLAQACAAALGLADSAGLAVDVGVRGGLPAIALVGRGPDGTVTLAVTRTCDAPTAQVLQDPLVVP